MKKIFLSAILIFIMLLQSYSYAVEEISNIKENEIDSNITNQSSSNENIINTNQIKTNKEKDLEIEFEVLAPKTIQEGETVYLIELSLGKFSQTKEGKVMAFQTTLEYNETIVDSIAVKGDKNWVLSYSSQNKLLLGDTASVEENSSIGQIEFTLKEGLKVGQNINIKLIDVLILFNGQEIKINKEIDFEIIQKKEEIQENIINTIQNTQIDNTITSKIIPAAGMGKIVLILLAIIILVAVIFKFKSRKIKY